MWDWFVNFLTQVLAFLANTCGDWGVAVIILTVIIRILIMPLMTRSTASTARMQALQPLLQELQEKYADDPVRLNEEMRKFQAEHNFNPLGGCLPMFLQMPVFFALFTVARNVPADAHFLNILPSLSVSVREAIALFGISGAMVYIIFDIAFGLLTLIPMVLNSRTMTDEAQRQQSLVMGVMMGAMMIWFGLSVPAAVLLYYNTSAIWQIVQQQLVTNRVMEKVKAEEAERLAAQPVKVDVVRKERKPRPKKKG
ncbi:MAG: YidC/Oxa1 family membrane protein insertase [Atopobiaceae bacterium]|nr:YidC/Oxa1 family membrane protein insertase [Atopobiaceae bacterium]